MSGNSFLSVSGKEKVKRNVFVIKKNPNQVFIRVISTATKDETVWPSMLEQFNLIKYFLKLLIVIQSSPFD